MDLGSCSSSFTDDSKFDVFLSFRGEDTRYGFTGHLYKALYGRGISTFIDDENLQRGEEITAALVKAIQESRIAIIVLSKDYASSSFCLHELATILECRLKGKDRLVLPVFYKVDPSHVRNQTGSYGDAFAGHEERFRAEKEKLKKWKEALSQVANLSGYHIKDRDEYEYKFVEKIVEQVSSKINRVPLRVAEYPVGLESQELKVRNLLDVGCDDGVHMIGISGMGGIGKSTLARAVYNNLIDENFDGVCFLENVREKSNKYGLEHLQGILLSKILGEKDINFTCWEEGASVIPQKLHQKKVLLVLDDVDKPEQLQAIAGGHNWFGPSSRIIITTRDKQLLASHEVIEIYQVKELNNNDALQLLTWKAFKKEKADPRYEQVLNCVVKYASGLPLALEVIGSNLFGKSIEKWEDAINQYERSLPDGIQGILKVSFEALEEEEKSVFLDIACFFNGYQLTKVKYILCAHYGHNMKCHIDVLVEKSLMKLDFDDSTITLHDLIEHMGKDIVRQESLDEPEERSRLWSWEDIKQVLEDNTGTSKIKIICLEFPIFSKEMVEWDGKAFKKMKKLRTLIIKNGNFSKGPKYLPNSLRVLEWWGYPSHCLPSDFQPKKLVIFKLPNSCFKSFEFESKASLKSTFSSFFYLINSLYDYSLRSYFSLVFPFDCLQKFVNLRVLNFNRCKYLTQIPNVSGSPNLEKLSFEFCDKLVKVHESVGSLGKLKKLSAFGCAKLESFPSIHLTSLKELDLSDCSSLESFPKILGKMENIRQLHLENTPIKELPFSFHYLIRLKLLSLDGCGIVQFPSSIVMMPELTNISAGGLKEWKWIKQEEDEENVDSIVSSKVHGLSVIACNLNDDFFSIGFMRFARVQYLNLSRNNFTCLPKCIEEFHSLRCLTVSDCKQLQEIKGVPPNLTLFYARNCISLTSSSTSMFINQESQLAQIYQFCLPGICIPEWFDLISRGPSSSFWFRNKLPNKILCFLIAPVEYNDYVGVFRPVVLINGKVHRSSFYSDKTTVRIEMDHTNLSVIDLSYPQFEVPSENEWNHVEVTYAGVIETSIVKASGIHVFKQESSTEDIRFTDPNKKRKLDDYLNSLES